MSIKYIIILVSMFAGKMISEENNIKNSYRIEKYEPSFDCLWLNYIHKLEDESPDLKCLLDKLEIHSESIRTLIVWGDHNVVS